MRRYLYLILLLFSISCSAKTVTPERYGAIGDSMHDDSEAFNKCILSGKTIKLKKGKTYRLKSALHAIPNKEFLIKGRNATIVVDKDYPLTETFSHIFYFDNNVADPSSFAITDLNIDCELGQKFKDTTKRGDTYFIDINKCDIVDFRNVSFKANGHNSNLTFLTSLGSDVTMRDCNIQVNSLSVMGGIFWLMNKNKQTCKIDIENCFFEHDAADEAMCFSNARTNTIPYVDIIVNIKNSTFFTKAQHPSSGFIICYNMGQNSHMRLQAEYERTNFISDGLFSRKIVSYNCGTEHDFDYGCFKSHYKHCTFSMKAKEVSEKGLMGLIAKNSNQVTKENVSHSFADCVFDISNIWPILGDRDGNHKGLYRFERCSINTNGRAFQKIYNQNTGDITLEVRDCKIKSSDRKIVAAKYIDENNTIINQ